jgi:parvulin-like peptidyl-prolyl isomerase
LEKVKSLEKADEAARRRTLFLLGVGAAAGLFAAAYAIVVPPREGLDRVPKDGVAVVNGEIILRDRYERLLAGFESDARNPIDDGIREHILNRMIEEELLVQRALELGLAQIDRRVRADLTSSLIDSVVSTAAEEEPDDADLREFFQRESAFFARPGRLRVRQILFRLPYGEEAAPVRKRAIRARQAILAGGSFAEVKTESGDPEISPIPDTLLPPQKLREYIGPSALAAAEELEVGEISEPIQSGVGLHLLQKIEATPSINPAFDEIRSQVRNEWVRRAGDRALRVYLDQLRAESQVLTALPPNS